MSYKKLEAVAEGVRRYLPLTEAYDGQRWSVNAQQILEDTLPRAGFNFHIAEDSELQQCAAFAVPEHNLIVVRQDVYEGLFTDEVFSRSTVVHELSHIVLRHAVTLHRGAPVGQHEFYEDSEWQANALMAAIMMPVPACAAAASAQDLATMCGTSVLSATYRIDGLVKRKVIPEKSLNGKLFG
ncbi:MAG: ImmA/IrrE family metallo-endopeptidase [Proteobacteria bacterium]|nr:ImmA/IrrE family metallo-endopeptidase [Pseudomonadota bacterium]